MRTSAWAGLLVVTSAVVASGQESHWAGAWRDEATGEARSVSVDEAAQASTTVLVRGVPVTCRGHSLGSSLALQGELPRTRGLTGVLEDRDLDDGPRGVRVDVMPEAEGEDGSERALVRVRLGRRQVREERWTRPGPARLEVVRTEGEGAGGLDPIERGLTVHVRVLGRAQDVTLAVELPPGDRSHRPSFYRQEGARGRTLRVVRAGVLEPGEHALEWDGRDGTGAARIALQGVYVVRVDSPERRADAARSGQARPCELDVRVARPRATVHAPLFDTHANTPGTTDVLAATLRDEYEVEHTTASETAAQFMARLPSQAVCYVDTHGAPSAALVGDGESIQPADVQNAGIASEDGKPLRDVHAVFLAACKVGRPQVVAPPGVPAYQADLSQQLLSAGVDVVVTFRSSVIASEVAVYHHLLGPRLLEYGAPIDRATHDAARQAAEDAHYAWTELVIALEKGVRWDVSPAGLLGSFVDVLGVLEALEPVEDALVIRAAPGIDPATETLMPARHGRSTN